MSPLNIILLIIWALSCVSLIILVLMHSGKGTGVSDMIASSMYNSAAGSGVWERNLDRLTVIAAAIVLHEPVTPLSLLGIVLTLAGLVLSELKFGKKDEGEVHDRV